MTYQGDVSVRQALQLSLNVPAIRLLDAVGPAAAGGALPPRRGRAACCPRARRRAWRSVSAAPASRCAISSSSTPPFPIAAACRLARRNRTVRYARQPPAALLDAAAAWQVGRHIRRREAAAGCAAAGLAYKTGTSYGYRDAWSVGFDGRHVLGVWVGRADGGPWRAWPVCLAPPRSCSRHSPARASPWCPAGSPAGALSRSAATCRWAGAVCARR